MVYLLAVRLARFHGVDEPPETARARPIFGGGNHLFSRGERRPRLLFPSTSTKIAASFVNSTAVSSFPFSLALAAGFAATFFQS